MYFNYVGTVGKNRMPGRCSRPRPRTTPLKGGRKNIQGEEKSVPDTAKYFLLVTRHGNIIKVSEQENASVSCRTIYRFLAYCPTTARRQNNFCSSLRTSCMLCLVSLGFVSLWHTSLKNSGLSPDISSHKEIQEPGHYTNIKS